MNNSPSPPDSDSDDDDDLIGSFIYRTSDTAKARASATAKHEVATAVETAMAVMASKPSAHGCTSVAMKGGHCGRHIPATHHLEMMCNHAHCKVKVHFRGKCRMHLWRFIQNNTRSQQLTGGSPVKYSEDIMERSMAWVEAVGSSQPKPQPMQCNKRKMEDQTRAIRKRQHNSSLGVEGPKRSLPMEESFNFSIPDKIGSSDTNQEDAVEKTLNEREMMLKKVHDAEEGQKMPLPENCDAVSTSTESPAETESSQVDANNDGGDSHIKNSTAAPRKFSNRQRKKSHTAESPTTKRPKQVGRRCNIAGCGDMAKRGVLVCTKHVVEHFNKMYYDAVENESTGGAVVSQEVPCLERSEVENMGVAERQWPQEPTAQTRPRNCPPSSLVHPSSNVTNVRQQKQIRAGKEKEQHKEKEQDPCLKRSEVKNMGVTERQWHVTNLRQQKQIREAKEKAKHKEKEQDQKVSKRTQLKKMVINMSEKKEQAKTDLSCKYEKGKTAVPRKAVSSSEDWYLRHSEQVPEKALSSSEHDPHPYPSGHYEPPLPPYPQHPGYYDYRGYHYHHYHHHYSPSPTHAYPPPPPTHAYPPPPPLHGYPPPPTGPPGYSPYPPPPPGYPPPPPSSW